MAEELTLTEGAKKTVIYEELLPQLKALIDDEPNLIANLANTTAALKQALDYFWIGFYLVDQDQLVLGPFQGPIACTRIDKGKGVCGTVWRIKQTIIVPDVDEFPGHITCSSQARSEIVVPGINNAGEVIFVLDIDSSQLSDLDGTDKKYLEEIVSWLI
jgi:GAF domain-containing protein